MKNKIEKKDLNKSFWRSLMYGASWNYERFQNLGFMYTMVPALQRLYGDSQEKMSAAMKRHLEFFNTQQSAAPFIIGVTTAYEEQSSLTDEDESQGINGLKVGLMGPLAGLGDSLIWLTLVPITMSIGAAYAQEGNPIGLILSFVIFNLINISLKYYGMHYGYSVGTDLLGDSATKGTLDRVTQVATVIGLILVGGLIAQMVSLNLGIEFTQGDLTVSLQELLDDLVPKLLPALATFGIYKQVKKGRKVVTIIFALIFVAVLLSAVGILA